MNIKSFVLSLSTKHTCFIYHFLGRLSLTFKVIFLLYCFNLFCKHPFFFVVHIFLLHTRIRRPILYYLSSHVLSHAGFLFPVCSRLVHSPTLSVCLSWPNLFVLWSFCCVLSRAHDCYELDRLPNTRLNTFRVPSSFYPYNK